MARKSRINIENKCSKKYYNVGVYVRLSVFNNNSKEDTIENQKNLILDYINKNDEFKLIDIYEDKNKTGTNFQRQQFERLLNDIKCNKINCIIVKDLSRLGRDYKECSNYIENIFPFLNVRFIAINDSFDSKNLKSSDILSMQLKNIVNDFYSKDISKKILSSIKQKKESGKYLCSVATYGYLKDTENKGNVIVDDNVKQTIINIFNWRLENLSCNQIALKLNEQNIDAPFKYFCKIGIFKSNKYDNIKWNRVTVSKILKNDFYIGNLSQGKYTKRIENNKKLLTTNKNEWIVKENNHTPIIDRDIFYSVQSINKAKAEKYANKNILKDKNDIFKGLLKCGCCGKNLTKRINIKTNKSTSANIQNRIICERRYKTVDRCNFKGIREDTIKNVVLEAIKANINLSKNIKSIIKDNLNNKNLTSYDKILKKDIININKKIKNIDFKCDKLYNDYLDNIINKLDYISIKNTYIKEKNNYIEELKILEEELQNFQNNIINNKFLNLFSEVTDYYILNREMILNLVENITIYDNKNISIKFKFYDEFINLSKYLSSIGVI